MITKKLATFSAIALIASTFVASASTVYTYKFDLTRDFARYYIYYAEAPNGDVVIDKNEAALGHVPFETTTAVPDTALFNSLGLSFGSTGSASITAHVDEFGMITSVDCGGVLANLTYCDDNFISSFGGQRSTASTDGFFLGFSTPIPEGGINFRYNLRDKEGSGYAGWDIFGEFQNETYSFLRYRTIEGYATLSNGRLATPVPLPASFSLFGLGLLAFGWVARRKITA